MNTTRKRIRALSTDYLNSADADIDEHSVACALVAVHEIELLTQRKRRRLTALEALQEVKRRLREDLR